MKRRWWGALGALVGLGGLSVAFLRPRPPEEYPLAELVPADCLLYAGFPDSRKLEELAAKLPPAWSEEFRRRMSEARPHLAGGVAVYLDRELQWVFLARLTRASALLAEGEVENGAVIIARTPEALARHKARKGALADQESFRAARSRLFFNPEALRPRGRLRDFSAVSFEVDPGLPAELSTKGGPLVLRGRAAYRGALFRLYVQDYVHAPRHGAPEGSAPVRAALTEYFPRLWDDLLHDLPPADRERVEREAQALSRDFHEGRGVRDFLKQLGPTCGFASAATPHGLPALVAWIDLADRATEEKLWKMLHKLGGDVVKHAKDRGQAPAFELARDGDAWRVRFPWAPSLRLGEAFAPAYKLEQNRLVLTTCASVLDSPAVAGGESHAALTVEVAAALEMLRSLAPFFADGAFRDEADRAARALYDRMYDPAALATLRREVPDPFEREKFLAGQRAQLEARALADLAKTPRYEEGLGRQQRWIERLAEHLSWLERVTFSARFTGDGLDFEIRAWPKATPTQSHKDTK